MTPETPTCINGQPRPEHQALNRRVRGVRFARLHYRLACTAPFARRLEEIRPAAYFGSESFAFRRS